MPDQRTLGAKPSVKQRVARAIKQHACYPLRYMADRIAVQFNGKSDPSATRRVAIISDGFAGCSEEQISPLCEYRERLRDQYKIVLRQMNLDDVLISGLKSLSRFDIICLKMTYRTPCDMATDVIDRVRASAPGARIVYLDGDDDICVQWNHVISKVDLYVKKHAFVDRSEYKRTFVGKSNLHDYVFRNFGHEVGPLDYGNLGDEPVVIRSTGPIDTDDLKKIVVGWNIGLDRRLKAIRENAASSPINFEREIDITFRGSAAKNTVVSFLRGGITDKLRAMENDYKILAPAERVDQAQYYAELKRSKICVSPFGFGEICWRDFEAVFCGSLLVKPDMGHIETDPNIFQAYETYVPVKWDFSNLEEVCRRYLENEAERRRIVTNARSVLLGYFENEKFLEVANSVLSRAPLEQS